MIHQLRIYEIFDHNKQAFHDRFRDHAMRIMESHGFDFVNVWETTSSGRTSCAYLLAWPNQEAMEKAWASFRDDQEWKDVKVASAVEHGQLLGDVQDLVLTPTEYSPPG